MIRIAPITYFCLATIALALPSAHGSLIVIDSFEDGTIALEATNSTPNVQLLNQPTTSAIGGYRDTAVILSSDYLSAQANSNPIPNAIAFSSGSQSTGVFALVYAGIDHSGLNGVDLTDGGTNRQITVNFAAADLGAEIQLALWDTFDSYIATSQTLPGGPGLVSFPFLNLSNQGIDLTSIKAIEVNILGQEEGDYTINSIYATVPEPTTLMIWSAFGVGVALFIRRNGVT
ncbi:MAG: hypothetical protein P8N76_18800 [Pirellulaceae bacterium]|nr:hypothetical protein [Pirellulaceae bacterium]